MFYEKQDSYKIIRKLTYHIGNMAVDLKENDNINKQDVDIAAFTYEDARYIRKEIQMNNEEIYYLYTYINMYSKDIQELEYVLNMVEGIMASNGMQTIRAVFRQEQVFISCLPIMKNHEDVAKIARRNVLTSGLISTYPFITSSIADENGIFIGTNMHNNALTFVDKYCVTKYKNANMCIFGMSGSGKSFYTKLLVCRYRILGIEQYVIDPDREYTNLAKNLDGEIIKIGAKNSTYINIMEIREDSSEENSRVFGNKNNKDNRLF
jgi:type IV secretory pathway VirB4 component